MESATQRATASAPAGPLKLDARAWWSAIKRAAMQFRDHELTDSAAGLTYYAVLSIFPALIALVSILGLAGDSAIDPLVENIESLAPGQAQEILLGAIEQISSSQAAGLALILGLAGAVWTASGYIGGFSRASNRIYEIDEGRPFWKLRPLQIAITIVMILLLVVCAIAVVVTGPLARELGDVVGVGETAVTMWEIAKWPVIAVTVITLISVLYWAAPNVRQPGFRWITPGSVVALVLWVAASALFAFYVANFSSYNATYGSIAAVIVFLVWLWITNLAILFGAELNAELERQRELEAGVREADTIALDPRDPADDQRRSET
jgi:membrane protein